MNGPLLRQIEELPLAAAACAAVIMCIRLLPSGKISGSVPDNLRVRTNQQVFSPVLQLLALDGVNNSVVFPMVSNPHNLYSPFNSVKVMDRNCISAQNNPYISYHENNKKSTEKEKTLAFEKKI